MGSEWGKLAFIDAVQINPRVTLKKGHRYPFVDMKTVDPSSRNVSESEYRIFSGGGSRFKPYDTLVARITPCLENGKIARYDPTEGNEEPAFGSTEFIVIRGRDGVTDNNFAYYLTQWHEFRHFAISQMTGSSGRQRVPAESFSNFSVPVPTLPEQRAIAHILGSLDDKIELNRKMNETLETMACAIFKSWFVDFDPVRAKAEGRDPGLPKEIADLFPDSFEDSALGEGWLVGAIGENFNLTMGQSPPGETYNEFSEGMPFFQGRTDFGFRYPRNRVFCTAPKRLANAGDTLVSVRAPVGTVNMAQEKCCIGRGVAAIRHKSGSRSYTYYFMHSIADVFNNFEAEGTVFGCINKSDFQRIKYVVPSPQLVARFEKTVFPIDQNIESKILETQTLAATRDALLPKLLSGEIRIKETEKFIKGII